MSRIAKKPILLPQGVKAAAKDGSVHIEGPKGKLSEALLRGIKIEIKDKEIWVKRESDSIEHRSMHGTMARLISNMIEGVSQGFQQKLNIEGVGFRAEVKGNTLTLALGFSHAVGIPIPEGITVKALKATELVIDGVSKQQTGHFAARVRSVYEPEPYKGKGIRLAGEIVRRKAGKAVVK